MRAASLLAMITAACRAAAPSTSTPPIAAAAPGYVKGQLHVHSSHSGDSDTAPDDVVRWYRARGYDFIVFTDHNVITEARSGDMLVIPGVELTQNLRSCDPPPAPGDACLLHVNALFVTAAAGAWAPPPSDGTRRAIYGNALDATRELGGIAQLNHPNFAWGADAALIATLVRDDGLRLFEVANQSSDVANEGDATHPSTEEIWDAVLTGGGTLYGTATDDAHHYDDADAVRAAGGVPDIGDQGWVMVHAPREAAAIRDALARGDFYATTGVTLSRIERTAAALEIEAATPDDDVVDFTFTGRGGKILATSRGRTARFPLDAARGGYVRATVTDARGRVAWVQPVRVD
jgi:hypothetical protein